MADRTSMSMDAAKQAAHSWLTSRAESAGRSIRLGFPTIDSATPKLYGGQNFMVLGLKSHGKSPFMNYLSGRLSRQFATLPDLNLDDKPDRVVLIRGEETIERTAITITNMMARSRLSMLQLSTGDSKYMEMFEKNMLDPRTTGLPVSLIGRTANRNSAFRLNGKKWDSALDTASIGEEFEQIGEEARIVVTITDYMQCLTNSKATGDLEVIGSTCDWFLGLQNWIDAVNVIGVQCNIKEVSKRSPWDQIPYYGDSFYTQKLDHKVDGGVSIFRPVACKGYPHRHIRIRPRTFDIPLSEEGDDAIFDKLNAFHNGLLERNGRDVRIPERYIKITQDLFLISVMSWRDCGATGILIPVSGRGADEKNIFGEFTEIPCDESQSDCDEKIPDNRAM